MRDLLRPSFFWHANRVFLGLHPRVCGLQFGISTRDALSCDPHAGKSSPRLDQVGTLGSFVHLDAGANGAKSGNGVHVGDRRKMAGEIKITGWVSRQS
jgi:hypothetical protein